MARGRGGRRLCRCGDRSRRRLHPFFDRRAGPGDGGQMVRRPRGFDLGRGRRRSLGRGPALGTLAGRGAVSPPLRRPADERGRMVASAQARTRRAPFFRELRNVRLAKVAGPVLERLPAETAHRAAINALKIVSPTKSPPADPRLRVEILGLRFPNPLGLAAGFDKNAEVPGAMLKLGFGFVEVGTLTPQPQDGSARPRLFRLREDAAVINRFGFNNDGFERARARLLRRSSGGAMGLMGVNIGANRDAADRVEDYVLGVKTFAALADYLTINISSPNTPGLRDLQRRDALDDLILRVVAARDETDPRRPLLIKIAPDLDARGLEDIVATALAHRIDGLIVSNTTVARPASLSSRNRAESGGLSGRPLFEPSTRLLARAYLLTGGAMPLIGCGGIEDAASALAKIEAGANLVQLYTGLALEGAGRVEEILGGLSRAVEARGLNRIGELVGAQASAWAGREEASAGEVAYAT